LLSSLPLSLQKADLHTSSGGPLHLTLTVPPSKPLRGNLSALVVDELHMLADPAR